jgi:hypothetical protein
MVYPLTTDPVILSKASKHAPQDAADGSKLLNECLNDPITQKAKVVRELYTGKQLFICLKVFEENLAPISGKRELSATSFAGFCLKLALRALLGLYKRNHPKFWRDRTRVLKSVNN